jgi:SAM-dependent methyltransferase
MGFWAVGCDLNYYDEWKTAGNNNFVVGTAVKLPFCDKSFNSTIAFEVLEHIQDPDQALTEIARCTKEHLILSVPNCDINNNLRKYDLAMAHWTDPTHCNFFTKDSLVGFLSDRNFKVIEITDCYRISPNDYYWDTLKIPHRLTRILKAIVDRLKLSEVYWSSILVVSNVPTK